MATLADAVALAAETLREHPERWTHDAYFRDREGAELYPDVPYRSNMACQACAVGMVFLAADVLGIELSLNALEDLLAEVAGEEMPVINDFVADGPDYVASVLEDIAEEL